ncbi:unnamed protein product [Blepharisma stoltei]|uniref:Uncharacterized protein n=1 Tax=Blepharisma stoltei TaxID=1481888 RepID=A0AAU9KEN3_9CILI|nr:unnamed protein product [Blepharisma stoltei]
MARSKTSTRKLPTRKTPRKHLATRVAVKKTFEATVIDKGKKTKKRVKKDSGSEQEEEEKESDLEAEED